jgi:hypothetical protein
MPHRPSDVERGLAGYTPEASEGVAFALSSLVEGRLVTRLLGATSRRIHCSHGYLQVPCNEVATAKSPRMVTQGSSRTVVNGRPIQLVDATQA